MPYVAFWEDDGGNDFIAACLAAASTDAIQSAIYAGVASLLEAASTDAIQTAGQNYAAAIVEADSTDAIQTAAIADPYWDDVLLLLLMEGTGSTLIDSSSYARTVTTNGDPGSLTVPITQGAGNFTDFPSLQVTINASPDDPVDWSVSHASDFKVPILTIEYFWYQTSSSNHTAAPLHVNAPGYWYQGTYSTNENFTYRIGVDASVQLGANSLTYSNVHHIATVIDNTANTVEVWMDGTRIINTTYPYTFDPTAFYFGDMSVGSSTEAATYEMSQVRITAARRYSGATITVPPGPFPTS
jgi:hypothetical protein